MRRRRAMLYAGGAAFGLVVAQLWLSTITDVSDYVRAKVGEASNSRVYLDDVARHVDLSEWSQACLVLPYANPDGSSIAPAALRRASWVGSWDEAEWHIAFLASGEIVSTLVVKFEALRLVEGEPTGVVCASRSQRPSLRSLANRSPYNVELVTE